RWCERSATQLMGSLLLDCVGQSSPGRPSFLLKCVDRVGQAVADSLTFPLKKSIIEVRYCLLKTIEKKLFRT
ncbi:MAG: hypothetical protein RR131_09055, partial [Anaerovorax sp.]